MASRQGAVKHGFVSKIAGGCSSYDVIAPWPDLTWSILFYQKLRKVCPIRYPKTRRRYAPPFFSLSAKNLRGGCTNPPLSGRGLIGGGGWHKAVQLQLAGKTIGSNKILTDRFNIISLVLSDSLSLSLWRSAKKKTTQKINKGSVW